MVFHVGIAPLLGEMALFNTINSKITKSDFREVGKNNLDEIDGMYKKIKATAKGGELGCAGIYVGASYGNEIRQKFIQFGLEVGFQKVEIIDWETSIFLNAISQDTYQHSFPDDSICVIHKKLCHFWQNFDGKFRYAGSDNGVFSLETMDANKKQKPNVIFYENDGGEDDDDEINREAAAKVFSSCQVFPYRQKGNAMGALVKARISSGDPKFQGFEFFSSLDRNLSIKVGDRKIMVFEQRTLLPLKESVKLKIDDESEKMLSISTGYFDEKIAEDIVLPLNEEISLSVIIDTNGIVSVHF